MFLKVSSLKVNTCILDQKFGVLKRFRMYIYVTTRFDKDINVHVEVLTSDCVALFVCLNVMKC